MWDSLIIYFGIMVEKEIPLLLREIDD